MNAMKSLPCDPAANLQNERIERGLAPGQAVWLVNHVGATILRCRVMSVRENGLRLCAPAGYGIGEGQQYELVLRNPNEYHDDRDGDGRQSVAVVRASDSPDEEGRLEVDVAADHSAACMSAF